MALRLAGLVVSCALAAACAPRAPHARAPQAAYAVPEPDGRCPANVQQCLARNELDYVSVRATVSPEGRLRLLDILAPALSPADALEVRRAFEACAWKPAVGPNGERTEGTITLAIRRR